MKDFAAIQTFSSGAFPNVLAINSTGAATADGSEYIAEQLNNGMFGILQALMDYASLTPDGVIEAAGASQILEAITKGFGVGPGKLVGWFLDDDPSVTGDRVLLMQGQGVLIASYLDLVAATYVGDASNTAVHAGGGKFYKSSDAAGTTPDIAGTWFQIPKSRGYALRGFDPGALIDPLGAARFLGDNQADAAQKITGDAISGVNIGFFSTAGGAASGAFVKGAVLGNHVTNVVASGNRLEFDSSQSTSPNTAKTDDDETRMANLSIQFGITY